MKFNKILSTALVFVMLFSSIVAVIPLTSFASESSGPVVTVATGDDVISNPEQVLAINQEYTKYGSVVYENGKEVADYTFETAEEMLEFELGKGYLDSIVDTGYSIYVNRYTGFVYYKNNVTGQILTSNPIDPAYKYTTLSSNSIVDAAMSQIEITYLQVTDSNVKDKIFTSLGSIKNGCFISVSKTADGKGISVQYTLADSSDTLVAPVAVLYEDFKAHISHPAFTTLAQMMEAACGEFDAAFAEENTSGLSNDVTGEREYICSYNADDIPAVLTASGYYQKDRVKQALDRIKSYASAKLGTYDPAYIKIASYISSIQSMFSEYTFYHAGDLKEQGTPDTGKSAYEIYSEKYPALKEDKIVVAMKNTPNALNMIMIDKAMRAIVPEYTVEMADADVEACGYSSEGAPAIARFKCSIEYRLDTNGELLVEIPEDSFIYDKETFAIQSISPLKYFGAGDMNTDGYIFFPDGSGTVVEFSDFYNGDNSKSNNPLSLSADIYGADYCYGKITGAHREQVTMPVFGMVSGVKAGATTVANGLAAEGSEITNGFFAIIEEGDALSELAFKSAPENHKYAYVYANTSFYLYDEIDLSQSLSVSNLGSYVMLADDYYRGSFKTRYTMLVDNTVGDNAHKAELVNEYYPATYVGMAHYYRAYLERNGIIDALTNTAPDLPLYIETLGSINVTKKVLSFPVTVSTPLTTFEDVAKMYDELANAKKVLREKATYYSELADETDDDNVKEMYLATAAEYRALARDIQKIRNVNFRLTGFANGGMYFTYPAKLKWEKSVGGKRGFKDLIEKSKALNTDGDDRTNMTVYPDFDFMYISNTSMFDGVSKGRHAARMVDNRYASKQVYSSITQSYEKLFTLLASTDSIDSLYTKFNKKYSKYDNAYISLSTLGSDLNSNFDEDNVISRETAAKSHVSALLNRVANTDGYSVMLDAGNAYALKYADHILNVAIDSSHFRYSSYTVPFFGMVLHGYVNYAGSALNYSGSPDYDILRAIENGASIYYILCCQNTNYLKEDPEFSSYYGIDYENWFEKIVAQYAKINEAIGDYQQYNINDHKVIIGERIIDEAEMQANYAALATEFIENVDAVIAAKIDAKRKDMRESGQSGAIYLDVDRASLVANLSDVMGIDEHSTVKEKATLAESIAALDAVLAGYAVFYGDETAPYVVQFSADMVEYESDYAYTTDSVCTDGDSYKYTDFSCDNGNVVMVVYENADTSDRVVFILNYNNFAVKVRLADGEEPIIIGANDYAKI